MELRNEEYLPEIDRTVKTPETPKEGEMPEILPRLEEIIPEKQRVPNNPLEGDKIIRNIIEKERIEQDRQERIDEIIKKRDEPKKKIH